MGEGNPENSARGRRRAAKRAAQRAADRERRRNSGRLAGPAAGVATRARAAAATRARAAAATRARAAAATRARAAARPTAPVANPRAAARPTAPVANPRAAARPTAPVANPREATRPTGRTFNPVLDGKQRGGNRPTSAVQKTKELHGDKTVAELLAALGVESFSELKQLLKLAVQRGDTRKARILARGIAEIRQLGQAKTDAADRNDRVTRSRENRRDSKERRRDKAEERRAARAAAAQAAPVVEYGLTPGEARARVGTANAAAITGLVDPAAQAAQAANWLSARGLEIEDDATDQQIIAMASQRGRTDVAIQAAQVAQVAQVAQAAIPVEDIDEEGPIGTRRIFSYVNPFEQQRGGNRPVSAAVSFYDPGEEAEKAAALPQNVFFEGSERTKRLHGDKTEAELLQALGVNDVYEIIEQINSAINSGEFEKAGALAGAVDTIGEKREAQRVRIQNLPESKPPWAVVQAQATQNQQANFQAKPTASIADIPERFLIDGVWQDKSSFLKDNVPAPVPGRMQRTREADIARAEAKLLETFNEYQASGRIAVTPVITNAVASPIATAQPQPVGPPIDSPGGFFERRFADIGQAGLHQTPGVGSDPETLKAVHDATLQLVPGVGFVRSVSDATAEGGPGGSLYVRSQVPFGPDSERARIGLEAGLLTADVAPLPLGTGLKTLKGGIRALTPAQIGRWQALGGFLPSTTPAEYLPRITGQSQEIVDASLRLRQQLLTEGQGDVIVGGRRFRVEQDRLAEELRKANPQAEGLSFHASPEAATIGQGGEVPAFQNKSPEERYTFVSPGVSVPKFMERSAFGSVGDSPGVIAYPLSPEQLAVPGSTPGAVKTYRGGYELEYGVPSGAVLPFAGPTVRVGGPLTGSLYLPEDLVAPGFIARSRANVGAIADVVKGQQRGRLRVDSNLAGLSDEDIGRRMFGDSAVDPDGGLTPVQQKIVDYSRLDDAALDAIDNPVAKSVKQARAEANIVADEVAERVTQDRLRVGEYRRDGFIPSGSGLLIPRSLAEARAITEPPPVFRTQRAAEAYDTARARAITEPPPVVRVTPPAEPPPVRSGRAIVEPPPVVRVTPPAEPPPVVRVTPPAEPPPVVRVTPPIFRRPPARSRRTRRSPAPPPPPPTVRTPPPPPPTVRTPPPPPPTVRTPPPPPPTFRTPPPPPPTVRTPPPPPPTFRTPPPPPPTFRTPPPPPPTFRTPPPPPPTFRTPPPPPPTFRTPPGRPPRLKTGKPTDADQKEGQYPRIVQHIETTKVTTDLDTGLSKTEIVSDPHSASPVVVAWDNTPPEVRPRFSGNQQIAVQGARFASAPVETRQKNVHKVKHPFRGSKGKGKAAKSGSKRTRADSYLFPGERRGAF